MKISSWKDALRMGSISGVLVFALCVLYTHIVFLLTGGNPFVTKFETLYEINGIPLIGVQITGAIVAAILCAMFLRYTSFKYVVLYILSGCVVYLATAVFTFVGLLGYLGLFTSGPMNSFDFIFYLIETFPIGSAIGTVIAIIINTVQNRRRI